MLLVLLLYNMEDEKPLLKYVKKQTKTKVNLYE